MKKFLTIGGKINGLHALGYLLLVIGILTGKQSLFTLLVVWLVTTSLNVTVDLDKIIGKKPASDKGDLG